MASGYDLGLCKYTVGNFFLPYAHITLEVKMEHVIFLTHIMSGAFKERSASVLKLKESK